MRTLVIETATTACSVALIDSGRVVAHAHEIVGRGHAERLIPMIAALPEGGRADHVLVDVGPGSFTGVRVGIAAARGLALGWGVSVSGYSSLPLVAAAAFRDRPNTHPDTYNPDIAVVMEGGHGEVFMQAFSADLSPHADLASLKPEAARVAVGSFPPVGNGLRWLGDPSEPDSGVTETLPDAADAILLPAALTALPARPIYGRAPDAKPSLPKPAAVR
jgi:tRNA threonylcarbamoyl adenosine modification protein YeaZ